MRRLPVVAAVPSYNMGEHLAVLLPELNEQNYDRVFVLDDASTDGTQEIVASLGTRAELLSLETNQGAASARNLMLGALDQRSIIHFLDADVTLGTDDVVGVIKDVMPNETIGFLGGLVIEAETQAQNIWNYGPRQSLYAMLGAQLAANLPSLEKHSPKLAETLRRRFSHLLKDWPDATKPLHRRSVFWSAEANMLVDSEVFERFGGQDPSLREHEVQDFALRLYKAGLPRLFDPSLSVVHHAGDVRRYNRSKEMVKAEIHIARDFGFRNWFLPDGSFTPNL